MKLITAIFSLIFQGLESLFDFLGNLIAKPDQHQFHAEFGDTREVLSRKGKGFCLDGVRSLSVKESHINAMIIGGTGSGKTTTVITPSILRMEGATFFIHDPSGEIYQQTAGYLKEHADYAIKVINYSDSLNSSGYNPLFRIRNDADANFVASTLVTAGLGGKSGDPFWTNQGEALILLIILVLQTHPLEFRTMANVVHILTLMGSDPEMVDLLFSRSASENLFRRYKAFISQSEKTLSGIISTAKASLNIFMNEQVAKVTSFDSLDIPSLRRKKTAVYIQNSTMQQEYLAPINTIFFTQLFTELMAKLPHEDELDIFNIIDEASSFRMNWGLILANCRKYRIGVLLALQAYEQLINQYGRDDAEAIRSNCFSKLYYTNMSLNSAREIEALLGKYEYETEKGQRRVRPLMTADELRMMPKDQAILLAGNHKPMRVKLKPWYKTRLRHRVAVPAPEMVCKVPFDRIPIIPLKFEKP